MKHVLRTGDGFIPTKKSPLRSSRRAGAARECCSLGSASRFLGGMLSTVSPCFTKLSACPGTRPPAPPGAVLSAVTAVGGVQTRGILEWRISITAGRAVI